MNNIDQPQYISEESPVIDAMKSLPSDAHEAIRSIILKDRYSKTHPKVFLEYFLTDTELQTIFSTPHRFVFRFKAKFTKTTTPTFTEQKKKTFNTSLYEQLLKLQAEFAKAKSAYENALNNLDQEIATEGLEKELEELKTSIKANAQRAIGSYVNISQIIHRNQVGGVQKTYKHKIDENTYLE